MNEAKIWSELVIALLASSMHITWKLDLGQCLTSMCILKDTNTIEQFLLQILASCTRYQPD